MSPSPQKWVITACILNWSSPFLMRCLFYKQKYYWILIGEAAKPLKPYIKDFLNLHLNCIFKFVFQRICQKNVESVNRHMWKDSSLWWSFGKDKLIKIWRLPIKPIIYMLLVMISDESRNICFHQLISPASTYTRYAHFPYFVSTLNCFHAAWIHSGKFLRVSVHLAQSDLHWLAEVL